MLEFQYRNALDSLEKAIQLGGELKNFLIIGSASQNLATLHWQLGELPSSEARSKYAIQSLERIESPNASVKAALAKTFLVHAAVSFELKRNAQGYKDFDDAMSIARELGDKDLEALIWDQRGLELMKDHRTGEAEPALEKGFQLAQQVGDNDQLAYGLEHLAELELEKSKPDYAAALKLIDKAFSTASPAFKTSPQYYPNDIRGRILLGMGHKSEALAEFKSAVDIANRWRPGALPGDATNTETVRELNVVYEDYSHLAADIALDGKDKRLVISSLEVLAENRAASLREQVRLVYSNNGRLPDAYYAKLAELQAAQAAVTLGQNSSKDQAKLMQIRVDFSAIENKIGINSEKVEPRGERIPRRNSLRDIQLTLSRDQVLISISLGKRRSYLWAVTAGDVYLAKLPGEEELTSEATQLTTAVRTGQNAGVQAERLSRALFSGLTPDTWKRPEWMIVADGALLNGVPFCVLPDLVGAHRLLIEDRSLRFLPSELLLTYRQPTREYRNFVGLGDPIYSQADARYSHSKRDDGKEFSEGTTLARLPGSAREVQMAAKQVAPTGSVVLTGVKATRDDLSSALNGGVGVLHFAVHVVSPPSQQQQAALALSLKNGFPELLTPESIAAFRVPGSLVVLSGCSSGQGKFVPGAGLVGLSRAWLLAGAAAVVVSNWPTPDDSGKFFASFYGHYDQLTSGSTAQRAALALRRTQLDMSRGSGYQTSPSFWGAFAVIAKE